MRARVKALIIHRRRMINNNGKWIVSAHTRCVLNIATRIFTGNSLPSWIRAKGARGKCWRRIRDRTTVFPANSRELIIYPRPRVVDIVSYPNERAAGRCNLLLNGKTDSRHAHRKPLLKPCKAAEYSALQSIIASQHFFSNILYSLFYTHAILLIDSESPVHYIPVHCYQAR